jgi:hypothetical protein
MLSDCIELLVDVDELLSSGRTVVAENVDLSFKVNYKSGLLLTK